jgi:hypothetical protein
MRDAVSFHRKYKRVAVESTLKMEAEIFRENFLYDITENTELSRHKKFLSGNLRGRP